MKKECPICKKESNSVKKRKIAYKIILKDKRFPKKIGGALVNKSMCYNCGLKIKKNIQQNIRIDWK
jgi:hypothetical protein